MSPRVGPNGRIVETPPGESDETSGEQADQSSEETSSGGVNSAARRAARTAAREVRDMGTATRDIPDPPRPGRQFAERTEDDSSGRGGGGSSAGRGSGGGPPDDINSGRRTSGSSTSSSSTSGGSPVSGSSTSGGSPVSGSSSSGGSPVSSSGSSQPSVTDTPEDINSGRRATGGGSSSGSGSGSTPSVTDTPDDINAGRRATGGGSSSSSSSSNEGSSDSSSRSSGDSSGSSASGSSGGSDEESPVEQVRGTVESNTSEQGLESEGSGRTSEAARELEQRVISQTEGIDSADQVRVVRDGDKIRAELTSQGDRSMQDFREDQVAQQVIESTEGIDERSEVDVIQRGDSFEARLTDEGEQARQEAVEQGQRDAVANMGTTGRSLLARQAAQQAGVTRSDVDVDVGQSSVDVGLSDSGVQRAADRQAASFASDVRTNQFAREKLREEFASQSEDLESSDVDVDVTRSGVDVGLTEGGENRQAVASAAQNSEFKAQELTATVTDDGKTSVQLTDDALVERVAGENQDVSADDLRVVEREFEGASERRPGFSKRVIELTDDAAAERRLEQAREQNPNANFGLTEGEDGTPRVEVQERFDDGGRFLLIPGAEDDVEAVADFTGEFLSGAGQRVGTAVGAVPDFVGESVGLTDRNDISDVTRTAGEGFAQLFNVPGLFVQADEAGEFIGAGGAAGARSLLEGDADELAEFGREGTAAGTFIGTQVADQATSNPVQFGARLGGALFGSVAAFRLAGSASSTSGQVVRGLVQPGEELFFATAGRGALSRSALRARASAATDRLPDVRSALRGDTDSSVIGGVDPDLPGQRFTLDADATDAARGVSGPGRVALARGRIRRALSGVRQPSARGETDATELNFRGDDRAQAELDFDSRPDSGGSDVPESFTDFDGGSPGRGGPPSPRDDVLEGSPRDQISDDIADRARTQRRQNSGSFDRGSDLDTDPGGFSRTAETDVTTRLREDVRSTVPPRGQRPLFGRLEGLELLERAQRRSVTASDTVNAGAEDTSLTSSFTGVDSALGLDAALGQSAGLDVDSRPLADTSVSTRARDDTDVSPLENLAPGLRNETDSGARGDSRFGSAFDSRFDFRGDTETDTRLESPTDTTGEFGFDTTTPTPDNPFDPRRPPNTDRPLRPDVPLPNPRQNEFGSGSGFDLESSEDLFDTGFRDFEADDFGF